MADGEAWFHLCRKHMSPHSHQPTAPTQNSPPSVTGAPEGHLGSAVQELQVLRGRGEEPYCQITGTLQHWLEILMAEGTH
jgi:hypothetical protein